MPNFTVTREEENDSGFSRQVTIAWKLPKFRFILGKLRPKQRLKSPPFRVFNCNGFDVEGSVVFFPKGVDDQGDKALQPILGVELMHAVRDPDPELSARRKRAKKRRPTPVAVEVEALTDGGDGDEDDGSDSRGSSLGSSVELVVEKRPVEPKWVTAASSSEQTTDDQPMRAGPGDTIEIPEALTAEQLSRLSTHLTIIVKVTFLSSADDLSDESDGWGTPRSGEADDTTKPEENLFSQVLHKGHGMWSHLLQDVAAAASPNAAAPSSLGAEGAEASTADQHTVGALSGAAAAASAAVAGAASSLFHRHPADVDYSAEWQPLAELFCNSESAPNSWRLVGPGCWSVFVHCLCDIDGVFLSPAPTWLEAASSWTRPSPNTVSRINEWCPLVRLRLTELVPHHTTYKEFWLSFFSTLEVMSRCNPLRDFEDLSKALELCSSRDAADAESCLNTKQLLQFALHAESAEQVHVVGLSRADMAAHLESVEQSIRTLRTWSLDALCDATTDKATPAREISTATSTLLDVWRAAEAQGIKQHHATVERVRGICEHGQWSLAARRVLASASERGVAGLSELVDAIAFAADAASQFAVAAEC